MHYPLDFAMAALQWALLAGSLVVWWHVALRLRERRPLVEYEPHAEVPWSGLDLIVLGVGVLALESIARFIAVRSLGADAAPLSAPMVASAAISRIVWLLLAIVYLVRQTGAYADDMGVDLRRLKSDVRLGGLAFLAAVLPVYGIQLVLTRVFDFPSKNPLKQLIEDEPTAGAMTLLAITAVGMAPLVEEFFFRVVLQGWLEKAQGRVLGMTGGILDRPAGFGPIVVAGAIFGLLHLSSGIDGVALFVLSLFIGYVYQRTHRIVAPLTVHLCVNALAVLELWRIFSLGRLASPLE